VSTRQEVYSTTSNSHPPRNLSNAFKLTTELANQHLTTVETLTRENQYLQTTVETLKNHNRELKREMKDLRNTLWIREQLRTRSLANNDLNCSEFENIQPVGGYYGLVMYCDLRLNNKLFAFDLKMIRNLGENTSNVENA
jgi:hypothetical protein